MMFLIIELSSLSIGKKQELRDWVESSGLLEESGRAHDLLVTLLFGE